MIDEPAGEQASTGPPEAGAGPLRASDLLAGTLAAFQDLADLGDAVEEEWSYVTKLVEVGRARLRAALPVADATIARESVVAIEVLAAEAGRITDPHRAIDWLSTFPAVAELAFRGGDVANPGPGSTGGA